MCTTCGCGGEATLEGHAHVHRRQGRLRAAPPAAEGIRTITLERDLLAKNDAHAADNRAAWAGQGYFALNLVSSPGSGKTTLLTALIERLKDTRPIGVVEGDQQTSFDADRIRATGVPALQINTGKGCHLDAHMVGQAVSRLGLPAGALLFVENVGNLVCPAAFDLGEAHKVVILSVTEGEDKPLKYPDMFAAADVLVLNKVDLLPHLSFDVDRCLGFARRVNPRLQVFQVSATTGEGLDALAAWIATAQPPA
jgi:hydrogenase nickel incorporation protein HypB